ncbi:MAG: hypothetical protein ACXAE3_04755 [Candidatus Kariarchaeaceae archaeon]
MRFLKYSPVILLCAILILGSAGQAQISVDQDGNFDFENDLVHIKVTGNGNVPKYTVWAVDNPDVTYNLFFNSIFTANDTDGDGIYIPGVDEQLKKNQGGSSVSLPSSTWVFGEVENRTDGGADFNISSSDLGDDFDGVDLTLANHIAGEASELKFDVLISGFSFEELPETAMMVFVFTLSSDSGSESTQTENSVEFGDDGYFESEPTAQADNGDINVGIWSNSSETETRVYMSYEAWSGDLIHDPTVGVQASAAIPDTDTTDADGDGIDDNIDTDDDNDGIPDSEETTNGPELGGAGDEEAPVNVAFVTIALLALPLIRRKN